MTTLFYIAPVLSPFDQADGDLAYAVLFRDDALQSRICTDASNFFRRQARFVSAFFKGGVAHVVGICAEKQMPNVDARWSITSMQYKKTVRNWPLVSHVTRARCDDRFAFTASNSDLSVACRTTVAGVVNAAVRAGFGLIRKPLFKRHAARSSFELSHGDASTSLMVRARIGVCSAASPALYDRMAKYATV